MRKTWCATLRQDLETNDAVIIPLSEGECSEYSTEYIIIFSILIIGILLALLVIVLMLLSDFVSELLAE